MSATIVEKPRSRAKTVAIDSPSTELLYTVANATDESEVDTLVLLTAPTTFNNLPRLSYSVDPLGGGIYDVVVHYAPQRLVSFSWDTTGGTSKRTQSIATVAKYGREDEDPPDFQGAINVNGDTVEGCDITVPAFTFTLTHVLPAANVTLEYLALLYGMTGKTNSLLWKGFPAQELLFLGSSGQTQDGKDPEVSFKFAGSANKEGFYIGETGPVTIGPIDKFGWDFMWIRYEDAESENTLVKWPKAVYVEQVYESADFADLGIGS